MATIRPCLVIGASGDIGRSIGRRLICDGRPVALTHSMRGSPQPMQEPTIQPRHEARWYPHDSRCSKSTDQLVAAVKRDFGGMTPDLIYCAGIAKDRPVSLMSDDEWNDVVATNLTGAFWACRALSKDLMMAGDGRIVLIGSVSASKGTAGQANYAASKGGMEAMCRVLAVELGRFGVTCNVVSPGLIEGRMASVVPTKAIAQYIKGSPLRRLGQPEDVSDVVSLLLSEQGRYITGQTIQVDGGLTAM